jgi:dipeptidase
MMPPMPRILPALPTLLLLMAALVAQPAHACINVLVTKGASADGSTFVTYNADAIELYGELRFTPERRHAPGAMREVHDWETGKFRGRIKEAPATYRVVGNMNQFQVSIVETTFDGRPELEEPTGILDYGSLIFITLERSKTAREAIQVMTDLVAEYGYASTGESFSIADPNEVWLLELIGKGAGEKGAVWVARKIPDGYIVAHANQARIRQFPLSDPDTLYSPDVISFARAKGWFKGEDKDFSFADTYSPLKFEHIRFCEARVWSVFRRSAPSVDFPVDYVDGTRPDKRLPLWIKPDRKLTLKDIMALMRDHYEGTPLDMTKGVGAGPFECPYRWRPLTFEVDGQRYVHERAISTQQTFFSLIAQMRSWLPDPIGGVVWFAVDDTYTTVYVPMYSGIRKAPKNYAMGVANLNEFSWDSAFWVFNWVANYAYSRYKDMIVDIQKVQQEFEGQFLERQPEIESAAVKLYKRSPEQARAYLTEYSAKESARVIARWRKLGEQLLVKYLDGNVKDEAGKVHQRKYSEAWYREIVRSDGERLKFLPTQVDLEEQKAKAEKAKAAEAKAQSEGQPKPPASSSAPAQPPLTVPPTR